MSHKALSQNPAGFEEYDSRYMCCCRTVHSRTGVKVLFYLGIIGLVFQTIGLFMKSPDGEYNSALIGVKAVSTIAAIPCLVGMYFALYKDNKNGLLPQLIWTVICSIILILALLGALFIIIFGTKSDEIDLEEFAKEGMTEEQKQLTKDAAAHLTNVLGIGIAVGCAFGLFVNYWVFDYVKKFYNYLRDKQSHGFAA